MKIFNGDDLKELNVGYTRKYYKTNMYGMRKGEGVSDLVKMDTPRKCSYSSKTAWKGVALVIMCLVADRILESNKGIFDLQEDNATQ